MLMCSLSPLDIPLLTLDLNPQWIVVSQTDFANEYTKGLGAVGIVQQYPVNVSTLINTTFMCYCLTAIMIIRLTT